MGVETQTPWVQHSTVMLLLRVLLVAASACPVYPVEKQGAATPLVKRQISLSSKERESLIGHLQGLEGRKLVLTGRQKLALKQELALQEQGFEAFSSASDKKEQRQKTNTNQQEVPRNFQQFSNKQFESSQEQFQTNFASNLQINRFSPQKPQFIAEKESPKANVDQHPEVLLNQLTPDQKQLFQDQFNKLSPELQRFAYNKFISSSPDIQLYAINQFLSLEPEQLTESIKREKSKETIRIKLPKQKPKPQFVSQSQPAFLNSKQQNFPAESDRSFQNQQQAQPLVEQELQRFHAEASKADQLALKKQIDALKDIIAQQTKINFSNPSG